jgi:uncharacterized NAD-dependent epimerase/dehydratase family protein
MRGLPNRPLPELAVCIAANEQAARLTNPRAAVIGCAVNTRAWSEDEAARLLDAMAQEVGLPCVDPVRQGAAALVDALPA